MSDNNFIKIGSWERQILTVYQDDDYLFVSDSLWKPYGNKGAFGGQLFSQGIHAMMLTVENDFLLTSCHSHYILSADITKRIEYKVSKIRNGATFCTRNVVAFQDEKIVFTAFGTFKRIEQNFNSFQNAMESCKHPDLLNNVEYEWQDICKSEHVETIPQHFIGYCVGKVEREPKIIETKSPNISTTGVLFDGNPMKPKKSLWIRSPGYGDKIHDSEKYFNILILAFASDQYFLATAINAFGLNIFSSKVAHFATLDHTIWIHSHPVNMHDWHLYTIEAVRIADDRALIFGKIFSSTTKKHVATVIQEGLLRTAKLSLSNSSLSCDSHKL